MPHAELGSRQLYFERRGSGAPLLLIQGMAGHHKLWGEALLDGLAADFDVVVYDHRGIGSSTPVRAPFTIADLADDAALLIESLGWASAHVMGISLGGTVAQELVLRHPRRVRCLVLGCTFAGGPGTSLAAPGPAAMLAAMRSRDRDVALRTAFEANLSRAYTDVPGHFEKFIAASLAVRVPVSTVMLQSQAAVAHDASTRLAAVTAPTLVLHGEADQMVLPDNGRHLAQLIPRGRLHLIGGVGHLFWWEEPATTLHLVSEHFLATSDSPDPARPDSP